MEWYLDIGVVKVDIWVEEEPGNCFAVVGNLIAWTCNSIAMIGNLEEAAFDNLLKELVVWQVVVGNLAVVLNSFVFDAIYPIVETRQRIVVNH